MTGEAVHQKPMRSRKLPRLRVQPRRPRGRPKTEDLQALEARLATVARQAFVLNGYGATSINAIARSARVSKNTLYARFPSKAALFQVIVASQIASVQEELRPLTGKDGESLADELRIYIDVALRRSLTKDVLDINRLIMGESYRFPELGEAARARFQLGVKNVARRIEEFAQRDGIPCRDSAAAAAVLLCAVNGWYSQCIATPRTVTDKERSRWVDDVIRVFIAGRPGW